MFFWMTSACEVPMDSAFEEVIFEPQPTLSGKGNEKVTFPSLLGAAKNPAFEEAILDPKPTRGSTGKEKVTLPTLLGAAEHRAVPSLMGKQMKCEEGVASRPLCAGKCIHHASAGDALALDNLHRWEGFAGEPLSHAVPGF